MHATEFVESYFDAWNHRDPKAIADHLAEDGTYIDIPENAQRTHDELILSLGEFFTTYQHRYELVGEIQNSRNTVAFQYRMRPLGKACKTLSTKSICGAEFITLCGDAAMNITDYYEIPDKEQSSALAQATARNTRKLKYAKSGLNEQQLLEYKNRLAGVMRSQRMFLHPNLTLPKLAQTVGCSVNHLSQVINAGLGMSFFDYLNYFRIEQAKSLLSNFDESNGAVLNIAFAVGFNSNSAFYAAFKKCVGQTPAQFRRARQKASH